MPLRTPIWAPLTQWYYYFDNETEDSANPLPRPKEHSLSLPTGDPKRILNAAAAAANAQHIPPSLQIEPDWLKSFISTLDQRQQLPPSYVEQPTEQYWLKLADSIIDQAAADGRMEDPISQPAEEYLDAGYPVN